MKKLHIFANIKMNFTKSEAESYLKALRDLVKNSSSIIGVAVPSIYLHMASDILKDSNIILGAQNISHQDFGAFTGEINAEMIKDFNVSFALVGHSERRNLFAESEDDVNKKVMSLLKSNIIPIICVGEKLHHRENGKTAQVIAGQITGALKNVSKQDLNKILFAYEPVWAIGTGISANKIQANEGCMIVKNTVNELYKNNINPTVLYGGSLNLENAQELFGCESINGGLIGGAALNAETFSEICDINIY